MAHPAPAAFFYIIQGLARVRRTNSESIPNGSINFFYCHLSFINRKSHDDGFVHFKNVNIGAPINFFFTFYEYLFVYISTHFLLSKL
jgi:hypothetical protein